MTEVTRWLEQIGLQQYVDLFESRSIDFESLTSLTEQDLKGFGLSYAARRVIMREIERRASITRSAVAVAPSAYSEKAERRQLTIMFCDLVNSSRLSSQLDPEDLRDVIAAYQQTCAQAVNRYNGFVARYVGDGLLICFGYPVAHEDDAERAVRAGLDLVEAIPRLNAEINRFTHLELQVRVGIATGVVVVGDVLAAGVSDKDAIVGEAANLAARLQELASPNTVIVSAATRGLTGERFNYRDWGARELKGFINPVSVSQVLGERQVTRLEARSAAPAPFVGREQEIGVLLQCWKRAVSGEGQVVVISGEAGIGKSRLAAELHARTRHADFGQQADEASPLIFQCSPYHANAPLYPVMRQLERVAGIGRVDSSRQKFDKLEAMVEAHHLKHRYAVSLFGDLLGLEPSDRFPAPGLSPAVKRRLTIEALTDWCASCATDRNPMIVFEDAQWIDPTSRLLLRRLVHWAAGARALIAITLRSDAETTAETFLRDAEVIAADGQRASHVTVCEIRELDEAGARQLAAAAAGMTLSRIQSDTVLAKSEGVPLFVEELAKAVVKGMDLPRTQVSDQTGGIPSTIRDALMAQLDQLGAAKQTAQYAAIIGQEFATDLLCRVTGKPLDKLRPDLNLLIESRTVVQSAANPDLYHFRHALIRDVAYRSLLRKNRRQMHVRIAEEFAQRGAEAIGATSHLIAQHYSLGEAYLNAITYWQAGAKDAIGRSAHEEASGMLRAALAALGKLRDAKRPALELELVLALAMALRAVHGYSAPDVEELLIRARELCAVCADTRNRFNVEWGLFQCTIVKGDIAGAHRLAAGLYRHAERHPDQPVVDAHLANGMVAFHLGDFVGATRFLEKGVSASRIETDQPHFLTHGQSPGLFCLSYLARTLCFLGYLDRARAIINRGLAVAANRAQDPGHIYGYVNVVIHAVRVYNMCGDLESEKRLALEVIDISRRNHFAYYEAMGSCHVGWVIGAEGSLSEGINKMVEGLAALAQTGTRLALPGFYVLLAQLYLRAGQFHEANEALQRAVEPGSFRTRVWDADIERLRGDVLSLRTDPDWNEAERAYRSSLAVARQQGAGLLIFEAGLSLARLLQIRGRSEEGYDVLKLGLELLHEGFDTQVVRDAQVVLKGLAAADVRLTA